MAAHDLDETGGDGEAEAGAAVGAGGRGVGLREGLEDLDELLLRDADAGVGDGEAKGGGFVAGLMVERMIHDDFEGDLAVPGELDGVADEVEENLAEAGGVADEDIGDVGGDVAEQLKVFLVGAESEGFEGEVETLADVEGAEVEFDAASLDLREVEDVVDDDEEGVGGDLDGLEVLALLEGEVGLEGEFGHAEDAVHGGADLVAHVGEELALGAVCGLGDLLGLFEDAVAAADLGEHLVEAVDELADLVVGLALDGEGVLLGVREDAGGVGEREDGLGDGTLQP